MKSQVIKDGLLKKQGAFIKNWKTRWFVLKDGVLYYYKKKEDPPTGIISLAGCQVEEFKDPSCPVNSFKIIPPSSNGRTYILSAASPSTRDEWINLLRIFSSVTDDTNDSQTPSVFPPEKMEKPKIQRASSVIELLKISNLLKELDTSSSWESREVVLRNVAKNFVFSCHDINQVLERLNSENERVTAVRLLNGRITDPQNYCIVVEDIISETEKRRIKELILSSSTITEKKPFNHFSV